MIEANIFQWNDFTIPVDIRFDENSQTRKRFNGIRWRTLCRMENCSTTSVFNGFCRRHQNLTNEKTLSKSSLNEKNINVNKKNSINSRLSREFKTIVDGQTFLCEQHERECLAQKRSQSGKDTNELSIKRKKLTSSSLEIEEVIDRINKKLIDMHKNVDRIIDIRNSILSSL